MNKVFKEPNVKNTPETGYIINMYLINRRIRLIFKSPTSVTFLIATSKKTSTQSNTHHGELSIFKQVDLETVIQ